jgi:RTX calcium-binding nonapeptide repeat (4 copies)
VGRRTNQRARSLGRGRSIAALAAVVAACTLIVTATAGGSSRGAAPEGPARVSDCASAGPCSIVIQFRGTGTGQVTLSPPGVNCHADCSVPYQPGERVVLSGAADEGSVLTGAAGCDSGGPSACVLTVFADHHVQYYFDRADGPPTPIPQPAPPGPQPVPGNAPSSTSTCNVVGTPGRDLLTGTAGPDVICGLGGSDHVHAGGGNDLIRGGGGSDVVEAGPGNDLLFGGSGNDSLRGDAGADRITGSAGGDAFFGGRGRDDLRARDGARDRLDGGPGADRALADRLDLARSVERRAS